NVGLNNIVVRYVTHNTGTTAISCNRNESNPAIPGDTSGQDIASGASQTNMLSPIVCNTANQAGEQDTASIDCTCGSGAPNLHVTDSDTADWDCCGAKVDKEVSCDGGATWHDAPDLVSANEDGTNGCTGVLGVQDIQVRWRGQNTGTADLTCTLHESNTGLDG